MKPCSAFEDGTELWLWTIFHSSCSRWSTMVMRSSVGP